MSKTAILSVQIIADAKDAQKGLDNAGNSVGKFQSGLTKAAVPAAAALTAVGAAAISAAQAAAEDAQSAALLATSLKNSTGATDGQIAAVEDWISQMSLATATADDELRPALGTLVRATGDVSTAQDAMGIALDVAAATGKDLGSVTDALSKGYAGNTASLGRLVPGMDKAILATKDMDKITAELARTTGGSAAAAADTAAGKWESFQIQMGEAQEAMGAALLPVMAKLSGTLQTAALWVQKNTKVLTVLVAVVAGFAAAILLANAALKIYKATQVVITGATKAWAAMQWVLNAAMSANPITLIIIAVIALIAVFVLLWNKCKGFRDFVLGMWEAIKKAAEVVWKAIKTVVKIVIKAITAYIKAYLAVVKMVWNVIKKVATTVWNAIKAVINVVIKAITAYIKAYLTVVKAVWTGIRVAAQAAWNWIKNIVKSVIDAITSVITGFKNRTIQIWTAIKSAFSTVWNALVGIVQTVIGKVSGIIATFKNTVTGIWTSIKDAFSSAFNSLYSIAKPILDKLLNPIDAVKDAFDDIVAAVKSVIDWIGKIKMPKISMPDIDFTPWSKSASVSATPGVAARGLLGAPAFRAGATSGAAGGVVINVNGAMDPVAVARQIRRILRSDDRRRSGVVVGVGS